jgi:adenylosuccinate lyase
MLAKTASLLETLVVYPKRMLENINATRGLVFSGQLLLALAQKGVARETAYTWVQRNAMKVWDEGGNFQDLISADADITKVLSGAEIARSFSLDTYLRNVDVVFRRVFDDKT